MFVKKTLTGLAIVCAMVLAVTTLGSVGVFAQTDAGTKPMEMEKSIEVELHDDYFDPKVITLPKGTTTTLILKNNGRKEHTFTVEKLGIDAEVEPGKEKKITVKPTEAGTYELVCRYHLQEGMVGKVIVE